MADTKISALIASTTPLAGTEVLPVVQDGTTKKVTVANLTDGRSVSALSVNTTGGASFATTSGGVGVGTSSPRTPGNGYTGLTIDGSTSGFLDLNTNGDRIFTLFGTGKDVNFTAADPTGNLLFWTNGVAAYSVNPNYNLTLNYGNYVVGTAAKGINFTANTPAAGMTSQLLNWYEEGTWTPTISSATYTYTTQSGKYIRVGKLVHVTFFIQVSNASAQAGTPATIDGLPFNCAQNYAAASFSYWNDIIGTTAINGLTASGATSIQLRTPVTNSNPTIIVGTQMTSSSAIAGSLTYICS